MKHIVSILTKVFVVEFYRLNAAFFLLVGGLCFGFMSGVEHKALAQFFVSSPVLLAIPVSCWLLYTWKIILFNRKILQRSQNEFVFHLSLIKIPLQYVSVVNVVASQLMPIFMYGVFLMLMAFEENLYTSAIYVILTLSGLLILSTILFVHALNNPNQEKKVSRFKAYLDKRFHKTFYQIFIEWIARKDMATLIGSKVFSCLLLYAILYLYQTDTYDLRLLGIGLSIAFAANASLIFQFHQFENYHFPILRNLPLNLWKRLSYYLITYCLLCLPELGLLMSNFPEALHPITLMYCIVFCLGLGLLFYSYLYRRHVDMDRYMRFVFIMVMASIVFILFNVPLILLGGVYLLVGTCIFRLCYYNFEFIAATNTD